MLMSVCLYCKSSLRLYSFTRVIFYGLLYIFTHQHNVSMPQSVEVSPTSALGQGEEDCLYPISPQMLPGTRPYVQPHPLTRQQLYTIVKPAPLNPLPILQEFMNQLNLDPSKIPILQHYYYNTLPFARGTCPQMFPALGSATTNDNLRYLHMHNQQLQPQLYRLKHSSVPR